MFTLFNKLCSRSLLKFGQFVTCGKTFSQVDVTYTGRESNFAFYETHLFRQIFPRLNISKHFPMRSFFNAMHMQAITDLVKTRIDHFII